MSDLEDRVCNLESLVAILGQMVLDQAEEIRHLKYDIELGVQASDVYLVERVAQDARNIALAATGLATKAMGRDATLGAS